jgi:hypothetical protein
MLSISDHKENANLNHVKILPPSFKMATIKNTTTMLERMWGKESLLHYIDGNVN